MNIYLENPKEYTETNLPELSEFNSITKYKMNTQKNQLQLYITKMSMYKPKLNI